jgi:hypothetical protein
MESKNRNRHSIPTGKGKKRWGYQHHPSRLIPRQVSDYEQCFTLVTNQHNYERKPNFSETNRDKGTTAGSNNPAKPEQKRTPRHLQSKKRKQTSPGHEPKRVHPLEHSTTFT